MTEKRREIFSTKSPRRGKRRGVAGTTAARGYGVVVGGERFSRGEDA